MNNNLNPHEIDVEYITNELRGVMADKHSKNQSVAIEDTFYVSPYKDAPEPIMVLVADFLEQSDLLYNKGE